MNDRFTSQIMVSVIIPMYNSADTIIPALESVRKQDYDGELEIIIVDDGSTDNSLDIANQYKQEHNVLNITIINKPNGGAASARNAGLRNAKGQFIALLDADDEWFENKLKVLLPYFDNEKVDCIGSSNGGPLKVGFRKIISLTQIKPSDLVFRWNPQSSTVIFRKTVIDRVGLYNEMRYGEDGDYWLRISYKTGFYVIPDVLVLYGQGKQGFGVSGMTAKLNEMHKGELQAIDNIYNLGGISSFVYYTSKIFARIKYLRRKAIVSLRKKQ